MIEYTVNINGIDVNARYTEENINGIFIPLLQELCVAEEYNLITTILY